MNFYQMLMQIISHKHNFWSKIDQNILCMSGKHKLIVYICSCLPYFNVQIILCFSDSCCLFYCITDNVDIMRSLKHTQQLCLCEMLDVQLSRRWKKNRFLQILQKLFCARFFSDSSPMSLNSIPIQFTGGTDTQQLFSTQFTPAMSQFQINSDSLTTQLDSTLLDSFLRN